MKKVILFFLTLFVASSVWAFNVNNIAYTIINGNEVMISSATSANGTWDGIIPSTVTYEGKTYNVVKIGTEAFKNVTRAYWSSNKMITIPNSVTEIGEDAFYGCEGFESIKLPDGMTEIGDRAFAGCKVSSIILPDGLTSIGQGALGGCDLTSITIPDGVTSIGQRALGGCENLTSITIPDGVTSIEAETFSGCTSLTSITLPDGVTSIGQLAFENCTSLSSITIPSNVAWIDRKAFKGCRALISVSIPDGVTSIEAETFSGCTNLRSITIPNSVTKIGGGAFSGCTSLTSVTIPNSVTKIGDKSDHLWGIGGTFEECTNLISVIIPSSVTSIEAKTFSGCTSLSSIQIPNSVTEIGRAAFTGTGLTSLTLNGVTTIAEGAFSYCESITSITIENVPEIKRGSFYGCTNLTSVTINNVASLGEEVFSGCSNLSSITIPSSVTTIGEKAFSGCTNLKDVTCLSTTPPEANANTFENYNGYLHVPCESKDEYDFANCWGSFKHVECIGAETVELTKDEVKVEPERSAAVFTMPQNESANSYTLTIQNNGVTFCTLTFNAQGQLSNIDFSTTKSYELKASVSAYQFTVTGLSEATDYGYSFKALASNKSVLKEYTGSFTTKNADGTGGSVQGGGEGTLAVDAVSNATAVTIVNGQILVNGEAPAFVVTVSGKKTANANLKAGVYFVAVEGETVGVSVR